MTENRVDSVTRFTDKAVSLLYLAANIVVAAATDAPEEMIHETSIVPLIPHSISAPKTIRGTAISRSATQRKLSPSLNAEAKLDCDR